MQKSQAPNPPNLPDPFVAEGLAWGLGIASASVMTAVLAGRWLTVAGSQLGQASEEVFRGDRLPLLNRSEESRPTPPRLHHSNRDA